MRRKTSCPYCYHRIPAKRLWYQCNGRGSVNRPGCPAGRDEARETGTGFKGIVRPSFRPGWHRVRPVFPRQASCPGCGSSTGIRVCPRCHTPLPVGFDRSRSPLIAMIGAKNTGKTVYLTVLANELRTTLRRRFHADVRFTGDAQGGAESPLRWLERNVDRVYQRGQLFAQTASAGSAGRQEALVFEWRQAGRRTLTGLRFRTTYLSFYDTAGEDLSSQGRSRDLRYLDAADALIVLLDPFTLPQAADRIVTPDDDKEGTRESAKTVLGNVTDTLRESRSIPGDKPIRLPVAVAFAKIDAFFDALGSDNPLFEVPDESTAHYDETAGRDTHEQVRALLHEFGGDEIDSHLSTNYTNFRYFVVSALGAPPDYANQKVDPGGVRPFRVAEPLLWLLSRFGVVRRETRRR
ncbi:hypothetical protein [Micromonospora oryzae]|uniref:hypothetical protein n=1 Tax=Micromonospora sp. DSM 102119 TaxID=3111768 RepID=UPI0031CE0B2D